MRLSLRLAWRNLWRHRRRTLIIMIAIGSGMAMMMMYDGIVAGFEQAIYANAIRVLGGNLQIHADGYQESVDQSPLLPLSDEQSTIDLMKSQSEVVSASRRITTSGLASNREGAFAVSIIGIEPEEEQQVSLIAQNITEGRYLQSEDQDVVLIGKGLADAMGIGLGDRFTLVGKATHEQMRQRTMTVVGIYDLGLPDTEKRTLYLSLAETQDLYNLTGQSTEIVVSLKQLGQEAQVISAVKSKIGSQEITSWETNYPDLQSALNTKGGVMNIFGVIIMIIAAIGILNLLLMAVYERTREIGLLGALVMKPGQISGLFLLEGALIGVLGMVFGILLGLLVNFLLGLVGLDYSKFTGMTEYTALITGRIYPTAGLEKVFQRGLTTVIISVLAAYYPAHEASRHEPAEALHFV